jgi:hypothetical protein
MQNDLAIFVRHLQAIDHHQGSNVDIEIGATAGKHLRQVCIMEEQLSRNHIVVLVKGPPRNENLNHGPI